MKFTKSSGTEKSTLVPSSLVLVTTKAMSALVEKAKQDNRFSLAVESDDPSSPPVERAQPKKKRQTKKPALKPSGPIRQTPSRPKASARVIRVVTPPLTLYQSSDHLDVALPLTQQPASAESSHQTQPAVPYLYQLLVLQFPSVVQIRQHQLHRLVSPFTPARPTHTSSHLGHVMSALAAIGSAVTSIQKNLDTLNKKVDTGLREVNRAGSYA
ncbi:unnamed protein product [Mytilus coruscus]|uniref:Uncharacterized protein n=1 Tax=Mytilus coruscus TaxID=42192 RepID=A0A6J8DE74_MYTCO|nr:unnamed protein product [Mytilus coruscus]